MAQILHVVVVKRVAGVTPADIERASDKRDVGDMRSVSC
jgi:hypothetical protein